MTQSPTGADLREDAAKFVYAAMLWAAERAEGGSNHQAWTDGGNSHAQNEARRIADAILALIPPLPQAEAVASLAAVLRSRGRRSSDYDIHRAANMLDRLFAIARAAGGKHDR